MSEDQEDCCNQCGKKTLKNFPIGKNAAGETCEVLWCQNCRSYCEIVTVPGQVEHQPAKKSKPWSAR